MVFIWLPQVALVGQEPILYARSIRRNILFGLENDDEIDTMEINRLRTIAEKRVSI